jgi:spore coat protein SA
MKILIIAPEQNPVPPFVGSSVENCIDQISKQLSRKHHITIVSRRHKRYSNLNRSSRLTMIRVPSGKPLTYLCNALNRVKGQRFDIIQIDNRPEFVPMVRRRFTNTMISVFLHSLTFVTPPQTSIKRTESNLSKANQIIGNSRSLESKLAAMLPNLANRINYVHLGVNLDQFKPPSTKQRLRIRRKYRLSNSFLIVFAGRLIPRKGIPLLIKATKEARKIVPSAKLVIAGGTSNRTYKKKLMKIAKKLKVPVKFLGNVPRNKMHEVYALGDCFVCPSQKHEAFGLVVAEALASGLPCIASEIGGIPEIIKDRANGLLVKRYTDPNAFSDLIIEIATNKSLAQKLADQGRKDAVRKFNWIITAERLESIYEDLVKNNSNRLPMAGANI